MQEGSVLHALVYVGSLIAACAALHVVVPATVVTGYACDRQGKVLVYRLNGLRVLFVVVLAFVGLSYANVIDGEYLANNIWPCFHAGNIYGLLCSFIFYIKGKRLPPDQQDVGRRAITVDQVKHKKEEEDKATKKSSGTKAPSTPSSSSGGVGSFLMDFYAGLEFNPRLGLFDHKMFLYLVGAVVLECVLVSAAITQYHALGGRLSLGLTTYLLLFSFFVAEYMYHEHVHLYTYDLFAERVGFKLIWGCLCFYPFFYGIGVWPLLARGPDQQDTTAPHAALAALCFFGGWALSRGANNQKYAFKTGPPNAPFLGIAPRVVPGSRILCSGWWGLARHINYLGEILMAIGLALPGGGAGAGWSALLPWLYPLYYVALLFPREREDSRVCELKYGQAWRDYCRAVPYRIIPHLY